jgi:hypothetical protein
MLNHRQKVASHLSYPNPTNEGMTAWAGPGRGLNIDKVSP